MAVSICKVLLNKTYCFKLCIFIWHFLIFLSQINIAPEIKIFTGVDKASELNNYRIYGTVLVIIMSTIVFLGVRIVSIFALIAINFLVISLLGIFAGLIVYSAAGDATWPYVIDEKIM